MKTRAVLTYISVSFAFSWAIALAVHLNGGLGSVGGSAVLVLFAYMCGPAVGALLCVWLFERGRRLDALGLRNPVWREMPWAWLGAIFLLLGGLLFTLAVPGYGLGDPIANNIAIVEGLPDTMLSEGERKLSIASLQQSYMPWVLGAFALFLGPAINAVLTLSEELGWRGYLYDQLKPLGFWRLSFVTGVLWGVWHMPIIWMGHNYPTAPIAGSFAFILLCTLFSPLYTWVRIKTRSVWGAGLLHGTTNGAAGYFVLWQDPMDAPWTGLVGIGGYMAAALGVVAIWWAWRREG